MVLMDTGLIFTPFSTADGPNVVRTKRPHSVAVRADNLRANPLANEPALAMKTGNRQEPARRNSQNTSRPTVVCLPIVLSTHAASPRPCTASCQPQSSSLINPTFNSADDFFKAMTQARVDNSVDRAFRSFLTSDLLILDDLGLHRLTAQQSADLYELILNRHRSSSFVITSNLAVDEWLSLFDDPILGNSALDRLANASYQIVIEGTSYRERLSPRRALLGAHGGD